MRPGCASQWDWAASCPEVYLSPAPRGGACHLPHTAAAGTAAAGCASAPDRTSNPRATAEGHGESPARLTPALTRGDEQGPFPEDRRDRLVPRPAHGRSSGNMERSGSVAGDLTCALPWASPGQGLCSSRQGREGREPSEPYRTPEPHRTPEPWALHVGTGPRGLTGVGP